jgi:hypothetical protein
MNDSIIPVYSNSPSSSIGGMYQARYTNPSMTNPPQGNLANPDSSSSSIGDMYQAIYSKPSGTNPPQGKPESTDPISAALGDATLQKIFSNKDILAIYEKMSKSESLTDAEKNKLVKYRDDEDIVNTSINQYLDFKKSIYTKLGSASDTESFIQSWQSLDQLPVEVKNSILSDLKGKLGDKIKNKGFDIDTVLKFDASTLKGNTAIAEAISSSFKELAGDQEFLKKFEDNQKVGSTRSIVSKGLAGAGMGATVVGVAAAGAALNWWNPVGWGLGAALLAGAAVGLTTGIVMEGITKANSGFGEGLESVQDAIGGVLNGFLKGVLG